MKFNKNDIAINWNEDFVCDLTIVIFGEEHYNPTLNFELWNTNALNDIVDEMRAAKGYKTIPHFDDLSPEDKYQGWYDFYIDIVAKDGNKTGPCIWARVEDSDFDDDSAYYTIDLTEEERHVIYEWLDEQCREHEGKSLEELTNEYA